MPGEGASMADKPFRSLDELCNILIEDRGLICSDADELKRFLARTNYYRFSGYAREFQVDPRYGANRFADGTDFEIIRNVILTDANQLTISGSSRY